MPPGLQLAVLLHARGDFKDIALCDCVPMEQTTIIMIVLY